MAMNQENVSDGGGRAGGRSGTARVVAIAGAVLIGIPLVYAWGWTFERMRTNSAIAAASSQGEKALATGDSLRALIALNHARELRPSDPALVKAVWRARARFLAENVDRVTVDNLEESRYEMEQLAAEEPRNATYLVAWAHTLQKRGDTAEADKKLAEAVQAEPSNALAHLARAAFLEQTTNKTDDVVAEYNEVLKVDANNFKAHYGLGRIYLLKKDNAKEIDELRKAIAIEPNSYAAHEALADAYLHKGADGMSDALSEYTKASSLQPSNPEPHWGIGTIASQAGRWAMAEQELRTAMKGKRYPEMDLQLGIAIARQNRCQEAMPVFLQFLREQPNNPGALFELGTCAAQMGQKENAVAWFRKVLDVPLPAATDPQRADAEKRNEMVKTRIASLEGSGAAAPKK